MRFSPLFTLTLALLIPVQCGLLCVLEHCDGAIETASAAPDCHHPSPGSSSDSEDSSETCAHPQLTAEKPGTAQLAVHVVEFGPAVVSAGVSAISETSRDGLPNVSGAATSPPVLVSPLRI